MAEICKILIADTSEAVRESLREILEGSFDLQLCHDGLTALELLHQFSPDLLVLELMLPGIDGLSLLQAAADAGIHPAVLATTRQQNDYILDAAHQLGVSYIMSRPCEIGALVERIQDLALRQVHGSAVMDLPAQIKRILLRLGFPTKSKGYPILCDAIVYLAENPNAFLSKEVYPTIGKRHESNLKATEKIIRDLIRKSWDHHDPRLWQLYFSPGADGKIPCPTNGDFLDAIVKALPTPLERSAGKNV